MTFHYSDPIEALIAPAHATAAAGPLATAQVIVIGSGYGGSVAAYRLSRQLNKAPPGRTHGILVLERGREYAPGEFPDRIEDVASRTRVHAPGRGGVAGDGDALFHVHVGEGVDTLVGSGLGGTSLINANVALRPDAGTFTSGAWPRALRHELHEGGPGTLAEAFDIIERLLDIAPAQERASLAALDKHRAFRHTAQALGLETATAPVAITLGEPGQPRRNMHGIRQAPCTHCGNCITGCNVGAKNSLAMNLIPAAQAAGVKFYTGARVLTVEPHPVPGSGPRWRIRFEPTCRETVAHAAGPFLIDADHVILAAGTLGSTEILARSAQHPLMSVSSRLGQRFSTNGDFVAMSFGERIRVGATGTPDWSRPGGCGPTITAVARGPVPRGGEARYTLEEGALPAAASRLIGEVLTTAAQIGRIGRNRLPAWFRGRISDPLAFQPEVLANSQVFLVMGDDGAAGSLRFEGGRTPEDTGQIVPVWPGRETAVAAAIDAAFQRLDRRSGLHGGQFVPSPGWRLLGATAGAAMSGTLPGGRMVTVHPLGGCAMAESGREGVVDHLGRVFRGDGDAVHEGLYVLDGAIVPEALGVNPFLTIAALAWRASSALADHLAPAAASVSPEPLSPACVPYTVPEVETAAIIIREQLFGSLTPAGAAGERELEAAFPGSTRWFDADGLILRLATEPADTERLLSGERPVRVSAKLYENPVPAAATRRMRTYGFPEAHLANARLVATGGGTVSILAADEPGALRRLARAFAALFAYFRRRDSLWRLVFRRRAEGVAVERVGWIAGLRAFWQVALMHATYREFSYELRLHARGNAGSNPHGDADAILIRGTKRLAWRNDHDRLWPAMLHLPVEFAVPSRQFATRGQLEVDMEYLLDAGLLTVAADACVVPSIIDCLVLGGRFGRSIAQVGFWEFGAPDYPEAGTLPPPQPVPPERIGDRTATVHEFTVPLRTAGGVLRLVLTRYAGAADAPPLLLVHGLAQGSLIYAHPALRTSMAQYFIARGFDVWLLDCRLSNRYDERQVPYDGWTIDEIGAFDVPSAVREILKLRGDGRPVHVFAHCVGATALTMAILDGHLDRRQLASVALNAIHPWTIPSPANRVRAKLGVFFRDWLDDAFFDPLVPSRDRADLAQSMLDRLAFSLARVGEQGREHRLGDDAARSAAICDRLTFLYGRMWEHRNVHAIHGHWRDLVGRAPSAVQRHLYYMLIHGRVLDHRGVNRYLTDAGVQRWRGIRTLFVHGEESDVFNAHSASRSAWRLHAALNGEGIVPAPGAAPTPVRLRRIPDYGHMDVILADSAAEQSFRHLEAFFRGEFDAGNVSARDAALRLDDYGHEDDPHDRQSSEPETGPILRAARIEHGLLKLRYWAEAPGMNTSPPDDIVLDRARSGRIVAEIHPDGVESACYWVDVECRPEDYRPPRLSFPLPRQGQPPDATMSGGDAARIVGEGETSHVRPSWLTRLMRRAAGEPARDCHFLVGSCHYPGTPFDRELAHRAFAGMGQLLGEPSFACDALFMIGDQIYADATANLLDPVAWRDRYLLRYREAFGAPGVQPVLQFLPVHFAVDDHEFADNYSGIGATRPVGPHRPRDEDWRTQAIRRGRLGRAEFAFALGAARSYMSSAREAVPIGAGPVGTTGLWYALDDDELGCPAFVMDTRSERCPAEPGTPARMMSPGQMESLLAWLGQRSRDPRPKFVFAGSVIVPLAVEARAPGAWLREDGFAGYPAELRRILAFIVEQQIPRVVFVGGDLHLSCVAQMELQLPGHAPVRALQVVASGLYAPLTVANIGKRGIDWDRDQMLDLGDCRVSSLPTLLTRATSHFVRVSAERDVTGDGWTVRAEAYDHAAVLLRSVVQPL